MALPNIAEEGIRISGVDGYVSLTETQVLDLISEGLISGLAQGEYRFSGRAGVTGWDSVIESGYPAASGTSSRFLRSIYWNEVPLVNSKNQYNFQDINVTFAPGRPDGSNAVERIKDELEVTRVISERLRFGPDFAKIYRIYEKNCQAARINVRFGALTKQNTTEANFGDVEQATVNYNIYYRPLFNNVFPTEFQLIKQEEVTGNISNGYIRSSLVQFLFNESDFQNKDAFVGWEIRIERTTEESITSFLRNETSVDSITEIYGNTFIYPNSAIVSAKFSAEYFQQVPSRAYDTYGMLVKIPANYDPIKRIYSTTGPGTNGDGSWDGTFADDKKWSDNPAWCFYDLVTNKRYGLGKYVSESQIDKWTLYEIAQYCDVLVPDGFGGLEPRFTCNLLLSSREEAFRVLSDIASIFNAITFYAGGAIFLTQDKKEDIETNGDVFTQFTNANVDDGNFNYSSSSRRVRHTVAIVRYNEKTNFYKPAVEYIEDIEGIKRYGIREVELSAFGCTSRGQAQRLGRWALLSETLQTETINFAGGMEASTLRPGDLFRVYDFNRHNKRFGGRLKGIEFLHSGVFALGHITGVRATLDDGVTGFNTSDVYKLALLTPTYTLDPSLVEITTSNDIQNIRRSQLQTFYFSGSQTGTVSGNTTVLISSGFRGLTNKPNTGDYNVTGRLVWSIEASGATGQYIDSNIGKYYRTINVVEKEGYKFEVAGLEYNIDKYNQIESGLAFDQSNFDVLPQSPTNLVLDVRQLTLNTKIIDYSFAISSTTGVSNYYVYAKTGALSDGDITGFNTNLINILPASITSGSYLPLVNGIYFFRVYAVNRVNTRSPSYASNSIQITDINPLRDVIISSLDLDTGFSPSNLAGDKSTGIYTDFSPRFKWQVGFAQNLIAPEDLTYRVTIREPSINNFPSQNIFFETTGFKPEIGSSPSFQFAIDDNISATASLDDKVGPFREYDVVVEAQTVNGNSSAGGNFIDDGDSAFNSPNGYDILAVNNPRPTGIFLTTGNVTTNGYASEQWVNTEGNITINFVSGELPTDVGGGYVFYSELPFSQEDASVFASSGVNVKNMSKVKFLNRPNPIFTAPSFTGSSNGYIALAPFDGFNKAREDRGHDILPDLYISNVVPVLRRDGGVSDTKSFRAWVDLDLVNVLPIVNKYNSSNIESVTIAQDAVYGGARYTIYKIQFEKSFLSNKYVVMTTDRGLTVAFGANGSSTNLPIIIIQEKHKDYLKIGINTRNLGSVATNNLEGKNIFVGILSNGF